MVWNDEPNPTQSSGSSLQNRTKHYHTETLKYCCFAIVVEHFELWQILVCTVGQ